jgi:hypothetical protein
MTLTTASTSTSVGTIKPRYERGIDLLTRIVAMWTKRI